MRFTAALLANVLGVVSAFTSPDFRSHSSTVIRMSDEAVEVEAPATDADIELPDAGLVKLAKGLNPTIGYFDPISLGNADFWEQGNEATIGFLRHAEIKHGRVAMAAFVGYCVQSNFVWPWANTLAGDSFPGTELSPEQQWDAFPVTGRRQIIFVIALLEIWDEIKGGDESRKHYMRGGRPGDYPSFQSFRDDIHPVLDLYDPFGLFKKMPAEKKERRLLMEINNGRLAMLGIFGFMAADNVPGSVPALTAIARPYDGQIMSPFSTDEGFFGFSTEATTAAVQSSSAAVSSAVESASDVVSAIL